MKNPPLSSLRSVLSADADTGVVSPRAPRAAALFAPSMWALAVLTLVYFYLMASATAAPGQEPGLMCLVVDEILNVIAPSLTLDSFKG